MKLWCEQAERHRAAAVQEECQIRPRDGHKTAEAAKDTKSGARWKLQVKLACGKLKTDTWPTILQRVT